MSLRLLVKHAGADVSIEVGGSVVRDVKTAIETATGVLARHQKLIWKGKTLEDGTPLKDVPQLKDGSRLMLIVSEVASQTALRLAPAAAKPGAKRPPGHRPADTPSTSRSGQPPTAAPALADRREAWAKTGIISLRDLGLTDLPDDLFAQGLGAARVLDASANRLEQLPSSLACLAGLASLKLSGNALQRVPWQALAGMSALSSLQLDGNHFAAVPAELGGCTALVALSLASNRISSMDPACLQGLTRLQELCLAGNPQLAELPASLGACTALVSLDATACKIGCLPPAITALQQLQTCRLDGNRVKELPPGMLESCVSLATLALHSNPMTVDALRGTPGYAAYEARRVARANKQLGGRVMADVEQMFSEGADVQQWERWKS